MKVRGVFTVEEVGRFDDQNGAVLALDGKHITVLGLTNAEVQSLGRRLYQVVDFELTLSDPSTGNPS